MYIKMKPSLIAIDPIGVGTPMVENLSSYIIRLAEANHVDVFELMCTVECMLLEGREDYRLKSFNWLGHLNFAARGTREILNLVEELTDYTDLSVLTAGYLYELFGRDVIRAHKWFYPASKLGYEPLLYSVNHIYWTIDAAPLEQFCHFCRCATKVSESWYAVRSCPNCTQVQDKYDRFTLGNAEDGSGVYGEKAFGVWCAKVVGEMLSYTGPTHDFSFASSVSHLLSEVDILEFVGELEALRVFRWREESHVPDFEQFLKLCYRLGVNPLALLLKDLSGLEVVVA